MVEVFRAIVDFGAVILIWLVQLVIYPSFLYFESKNLKRWHQIYTQKVTFVVAPIMFIQTGIIVYQVIIQYSILSMTSLLVCISLWFFTFFEAVPLHQSIDSVDDGVEVVCQKLIRINKKRTLLWSLLSFISVYQLFDF